MRDIFARLLDAIAPPLSIRRQFLLLMLHVPRVLLSEGPIVVWRRTRQAFGRYRRTGALIVPDPVLATHTPQPEPAPYSYAEWIAANEPHVEEFAQQQKLSALFSYRPVVTLIVPVYDPPPEALAAAIESVISQTYPHWQLCLVDGGSTDPEVTEVLARYADDERIVTTRLERNLGISGNSNAALALADGEYVALLDHDDTLAPNMLFEVVALLNESPETDIVYFDEDKLSADGADRDHPWFKPDYSPDLMLSANLLMHGVFRRSLIHEVGAFDPQTDGAQDWDLALRCTRITDRIRHIPMVLYHWRQVPGSASLDANAKPWAFDAQAHTLARHVEAADGGRPRIDFPSLGRTRIVWPVPSARVSVIIPTKDKRALLQACLDSIFDKTDYADYEIVLVDTGSVEADTHAYYDRLLAQHSNVRIVDLPGPFNYSHANNVGAEAASGDLLLFLNNDTEVLESDWLQELASWAMRPGVGVVGAKLLRPNGLIQHAGVVVGMSGHADHVFADAPEDTFGPFGSTEWYRTYSAVTGACMMVPAHVFEQVGGFDEVYRVAFSDVEFCLRAADAGYRTVYTPFARMTHNEGSSRGLYLPASDVLRGTCQMLPLLRQVDRNFNANLSRRYRKPVLARPSDPSLSQMLAEIMSGYGLLPQQSTDVPPGIAPSFADGYLAQPVPWPQTNTRARFRSLEEISALVVSAELSGDDVSSHAAAVARELAAAGVRTTVLSPCDGPLRAALEKAGVTVQIAPALRDGVHSGDAPIPYIDVGALTFAASRADLIIACEIRTSLAIHAATAFNVSSVLWLHDTQFARDSAAQTPSVREALHNADRVVLSTEVLRDFDTEYLSRERLVILPFGLDAARRSGDSGANGILREHLIELLGEMLDLAPESTVVQIR